MTNNVGLDPGRTADLQRAVPNKTALVLLHADAQLYLEPVERDASRLSPLGQLFPGPTVFPLPRPGHDLPEHRLCSTLGVDIGPNGNFPQTGIENNYQIVDNLSWTRGNHSFKFGGDFRQVISPQTFTQRERGDYQY